MGWLELLPLLKRLLPLLSRVAPMLETFVAVRGAGSKETEAAMERATANLRSQFSSELAASAESRHEVTRTLAEQSGHLRSMHLEVERLRVATTEHDSRMESLETQLSGLARSLKAYAVGVILLLTICITLLIALFLRR